MSFILDLLKEAADHIDGATGARSRPDSDSGDLVARIDAELAPTRLHVRRGSKYVVLHQRARLQISGPRPEEGDWMTVYVGASDGGWYVRSTREFEDGRFGRVL